MARKICKYTAFVNGSEHIYIYILLASFLLYRNAWLYYWHKRLSNGIFEKNLLLKKFSCLKIDWNRLKL
jgi:hypothetical protein